MSDNKVDALLEALRETGIPAGRDDAEQVLDTLSDLGWEVER